MSVNNQPPTPFTNEQAKEFVKNVMETLVQLMGPAFAANHNTPNQQTPLPAAIHQMRTYESVSPTGAPINCYEPVDGVPINYDGLDSFNRNPSLDHGHNQRLHVNPIAQRHPVGMEVGPFGVRQRGELGSQLITLNRVIVDTAADIRNNLPAVSNAMHNIHTVVGTVTNQQGVVTHAQSQTPLVNAAVLTELRYHLQAIARLGNNLN